MSTGFAIVDGDLVLFAINAPGTKMERLLNEGAVFVPSDDDSAPALHARMKELTEAPG